MKTFNEYLDSKGKMGTGIVDIHGDQIDPKTPAVKSPDGKNYSAGNKTKKQKKEKGFADEGDSNLVYKPDLVQSSKKAADIPTAEFAQYELVPLITESLERNPYLAENIVLDIKQKGLLGILVGELMEHRETYKHIATLMAHQTGGEQICSKLVRAMNEEISPAFGTGSDDEEVTDHLDDAGRDDVEVDDDMTDFDMGDTVEHGEPCPNCQGEPGNEECELCQGAGFIDNDDEEDMSDMPDMGMSGEEMPNMSQQAPAMQNFQRAMMKYI